MIPDSPKDLKPRDIRPPQRFFPFRGPTSPSIVVRPLQSANASSEAYYYQPSFGDAACGGVTRGHDSARVDREAEPDHPSLTGEMDGVRERYEYLDACPQIDCRVGYGQIGLNGGLGYENKPVSVQGRPNLHAISTHAPSRVTFKLDGRFGRFECMVVLNDDVPPKISSADFTVWADGRLVGAALGVTAGDAPRLLVVELGFPNVLELVVGTGYEHYCHAVWLAPKLFPSKEALASGSLPDCLGRTEINLPTKVLRAQRCIATVASKGFESLLDDMLGSLVANSCCQDALLVVFCPGDSDTVAPIAAKYGAHLIHFSPIGPISTALKSALYSIALVVDAEQYLCLDADMQVLGDLNPVFAALRACPEGAILVCREDNGRSFEDLLDVFVRLYRGDAREASTLLGERVATYPLVVNDGLFAGSRVALVTLDSAIRSMPKLRAWMDGIPGFGLRNQFIFNAALATSNCGIELDSVYNLQVQRGVVRMFWEDGRIQAEWKGKRVAVVHFNGDGRHKYLEFRHWHSLPSPSFPTS